MIDLPTILYKIPGPHSKKYNGTWITYGFQGANTEEELNKFLAAGWAPSLAEALEKHSKPKEVAPVVVIEEVKPAKVAQYPVKKKAAKDSIDSLKSLAMMLGIDFAEDVTIEELKAKISERE